MATPWSNRLASLARIGFDSNALIYALEGRPPYADLVAQALTMMQENKAVGFASTLVEMEMLVKPMRDKDTEALIRLELFLRHMPNLFFRPVNRSIARRAADLRARAAIPPVDAVITATAVEERCDAIIGNDSMLASRVIGIPYLYLDDYVS